MLLEHVCHVFGGDDGTGVIEVSERGRIGEGHYRPLRDENSEVANAIGVATDITERRLAEEEKQRLLIKAEALA